jgi:hypothetical protein
MRKGLLNTILCVVVALAGCDPIQHQGSDDILVVMHGHDRLVLHRTLSALQPPQGVGTDFSAIIWQEKQGDEWKEKMKIDRNAFQAGSDRERWIVELQSFDVKSGNAIIKVAEADMPFGSKTVSFGYSWREWSISNNVQTRFIRKCEDPFERY